MLSEGEREETGVTAETSGDGTDGIGRTLDGMGDVGAVIGGDERDKGERTEL